MYKKGKKMKEENLLDYYKKCLEILQPSFDKIGIQFESSLLDLSPCLLLSCIKEGNGFASHIEAKTEEDVWTFFMDTLHECMP